MRETQSKSYNNANLAENEPLPNYSVSNHSKADLIMDVAESMIRLGGFHAFSFRDIAKQVGLKRASVH